MLQALSTILATRKLDGDVVTFNATEDWAQGRTMFGGFLSALAVVAMRDTLSLDIPLRALQTNFIGPVAVGDVVCHVRLLRQGKSVSQVQCEIYSDEVLAGMVVGVFGASRETVIPKQTPALLPLPKSADDAPAMPFIPKITPNFLQHVKIRWALGSLPYMGQECWKTGMYLRCEDKGLSPEVLVVMLSDGPPTPVLGQFKGPVMASSVSWSLELPPLPTESLEEGWFQIDMDSVAASDGYISQSAKLWTPSGQLASVGYQVVAVYG